MPEVGPSGMGTAAACAGPVVGSGHGGTAGAALKGTCCVVVPVVSDRSSLRAKAGDEPTMATAGAAAAPELDDPIKELVKGAPEDEYSGVMPVGDRVPDISAEC